MQSIWHRMKAYFDQVDVTNSGHYQALQAAGRLNSIDILRGLVIVIMALDHTRGFFGITPFQPTDLANTDGFWFFTRWVTHFCAPVFVFLTGTSAFLYGAKRGSKSKLASFLLSRGIWLIVVELIVINASWQAGWNNFVFVQVIWAIGVSMIVLAGLIYLPAPILFLFSLAVIAGHNLLDPIESKQLAGGIGSLWKVLHDGGWVPTGPNKFGVYVAYPLIPWFAVMAAGYLLGPVFLMDAEKRKVLLLRLGFAVTVLFIALRFSNLYGDPNTWQAQERGVFYTFLDFINCEKYPPSLLFLCMTLGPALMFLPALEKGPNAAGRALKIFGSVPFFFYVIHVSFINLLAHFWNYANYGHFAHFGFGNSNLKPENYQASLLVVYAAWAVVVFCLYFASVWFSKMKKKHRTWWMSYL